MPQVRIVEDGTGIERFRGGGGVGREGGGIAGAGDVRKVRWAGAVRGELKFVGSAVRIDLVCDWLEKV
jgi:hypothetical protein